VRTLLVTIALLACSVARAGEPSAKTDPASEKPAPWAWELDAYAGYGQLAWPAQDKTNVTWSNGGPAFAVSAAYRGEHFTHPFLDISYVPIVSSGQYVNVLQGASGFAAQTTYASNSSYAIGVIVGPGFDIDWFRLRLGLGLYDVIVKTNVDGNPNTVSQVSVGFMAAAGVLVWRPEPFALGVEARLNALNYPLTGVYQTMWSVGLTGRWDFARSKSGAP
jgi:hypothetical protein